MTEYKNIFKKKSFCANCGKIGHEFKSCYEPITSWGIINIGIVNDSSESLILKEKFSTKKDVCYRIISRKYPNIECYVSENNRTRSNNNMYRLDNELVINKNENNIRQFSYYKNKILFMMVSRKFSLGFIEFIRGKYDVSDVKSIINLFQQMYTQEIKFIRKNQYDNILYYFLNRNDESKEMVLNRIYEGRYSNEYCEAKIKFNLLLKPTKDESINIPLDLDFYTSRIKPIWDGLEWGFPKGRRDKCSEENVVCACREFEEETGYGKRDYTVLNKIQPIEEKLIGTNGVNYKHTYYLSVNNKDLTNKFTNYDKYEINDVKWFTYDEAVLKIRPYHQEKKNILTKILIFTINNLMNSSE